MRIASLAALCGMCLAASVATGQTIDPFYSGSYSYTDLGSAVGVPGSYGGLTFKSGDPNTLLLGGAANGSTGAIYAVPVNRDPVTNLVTSFGTPTLFSTAPNIDGGLDYAPNGVLFYTGYPTNTIGQIKPGSTTPDKVLAAPIATSVGTLRFVPAGFSGAGRLKLASYNAGTWQDATVSDDGSGTYDISVAGSPINIGGGPEGIVYIDDTNPLFVSDSILVSEYSAGRVVSYEIDGNGDPIVATRRVFLSGLSGAEGATIDPLTGDFLFSTFGGGDRIIRVQGFVIPEPASLGVIAAASLLARRRR